MRYTFTIFFFTYALSYTGWASGDKTSAKERKLILVFHHSIGGKPLALGSSSQNVFGEEMTIEKFKYYVSHFSVTSSDGKTTTLPVNYFLVDEANSLSKTITLTIPDMPVASIEFLLGVDSLRNVSGVQTGALDPLNGMFWTWNSGYIMAKLEGTSTAAATQGHRFTYHIGGFKTGMNTAFPVSLSVPNNLLRSDQIRVNAEINQWFNNTPPLNISETPVCHSPGTLAVRIAKNYSRMFSLGYHP